MRPKVRPLATLLLLACLMVCGCARKGREVFEREGCGSCHRFRDLGHGFARDLSDVAARRDAAAIRAQISDPARRNPASRMPPFRHLSWFELQSLVAFLRS